VIITMNKESHGAIIVKRQIHSEIRLLAAQTHRTIAGTVEFLLEFYKNRGK